VYSNRGIPTLTVNGKEFTAYKKGQTDVHYIFENVKLNLGENTVIAKVKDKDGNFIEDTIHWNYDPAFKQIDNAAGVTKDEHIGL
jgi:beta-galactosidase